MIAKERRIIPCPVIAACKGDGCTMYVPTYKVSTHTMVAVADYVRLTVFLQQPQALSRRAPNVFAS